MRNELDPQYLNLIRETYNLRDENFRPDRTGVGSIANWGKSITIDLVNGFPIMTHRKLSKKIGFLETLMMLKGEMDTNFLTKQNVKIWEGNTSRDFLNQRGLFYLPEGHMGKSYSFQWRNFGGDYKMNELGVFDFFKMDGKGVDQIVETLHSLKTNPNSRRHIICGWNPQQLDEMTLPCCHLYNQYQVLNGRLNSLFFMRSNDLVYGLPYNFIGYGLLNAIFAKYLGLEQGLLTYMALDAHIYQNQLNLVPEILKRKYFDLPRLKINKELKTLDDIFSLTLEDLELVNYQAYPDFKNKPPMAV